jgi:prophage regulatory protein
MLKTTPPHILRLPQVESATGLKRERIRQLEVAGRFPRRLNIVDGGRAVGWVESEVHSWVAARIAEARTDRSAA